MNYVIDSNHPVFDSPHSNAVYQRVGFALIDSTRDITLTAPAAD